MYQQDTFGRTVQQNFEKQVFSNLHGLGHPSHRATKPSINTRFVRHGMNIDIAKWCLSCKGCRTSKISRHNKPFFGKFDEPAEIFDHIHMDIVGPLPYADGFRYLLTCVDRFTHWPEAIPLVDIRAETVADAFFSRWIARFGTPATITTDRGARLESKLWDGLCNQFGIVRNRTTSYHPQSNGMVERFHLQLKAAIMAHELPNSWTTTLPAVLLGARFAVKELLGRAAAEIVYGTILRLLGEFSHKYIVDAHTYLDNYSDELREDMSRLCFAHRATHLSTTFSNIRKSTVSLDRVKPAHLDSKPETGTVKQHKTQNNTKNATVRRAPALKQNSERKRAEPKAKTQTRSVAVQIMHNANRVNLPNQFTPYVAPQSRTPAVSRADGSGGGLRTYLRTYSHLRDKTSNPRRSPLIELSLHT